MMFGFGFLFMLVIPILVIGGIIWFVVALTRGNSGAGLTLGGKPDPLDILKTRYAKGEITKDQFDQMKRDLS